MRLLLLALVLAAAGLAQSQSVIAITHARVVDGSGAPARSATVLVQGDRIVAVGDPAIPAGARIVDASGFTLLPGLFDLHTHLSTSDAPGISADWGKNLAAYLLCGVTTVADLGTYGEAFAPRRELFRTGQVAGPHIEMAYRLTTPGGHGAEAGRPDIFSLEVVTPREARAAVQKAAAYKPDLIKAFTDGWRYGRSPDMTSMDVQTLTALVDEAHKARLPVITHTVTLARAKDAARAKVDILGHAIQDVPVDDELIRSFKTSGTVYVPTMAIYEPRGRDLLTPQLRRLIEPAAMERISPPLTPPGDRPAQDTARWRVLRENVKRIHDAGLPIACGTDAGGAIGTTFHGWATLRELELLTGAGLSPAEAIAAATGNSARALHVDSTRGAIAPGKLADLILIKGSPDRNIHDIWNIERVWLAGKELDLHALEALIQSPQPSPLESMKASAKLDDFESTNDLSRIHTRWENASDPGQDRSKEMFARTLRGGRGHALTILARMAEKDSPYIVARLPLQPGAVVPVDARAFKGIRFEVRGEGEYVVRVPTRGVRDSHYYQAKFFAAGKWRKIRVPFRSLSQNSAHPVPWTGADLMSLGFEAFRPAGTPVWLEIDNVEFYR